MYFILYFPSFFHICTFGANPRQEMFLQLCKIRQEQKTIFFHLCWSVKTCFSADRRQTTQAPLSPTEKLLQARRWGGLDLSPSAPDLSTPGGQQVLPALLPQSYFGPLFSQRINAEVPCSWCLPSLPRGGTAVGSVPSLHRGWPLCPSLAKVTAWRSRYLLLERKLWLKTKRFVFRYCAFLTVTSFQGQLNAKHRSVKFSGNFCCRQHQVKDNFNFRAAFISCFETESAFCSRAAFVWNNIA